jgi:aryl-alcohol dehydrogenase-like predicted oxidoreductase
MRYKLLGKTGLRVSELALGTMTFGEDWGWGASQEDSRKIFDAYVEAGGNFIDTSVNYTNGTAEKFVGDFVASDRERFVIGTKYSLNTREGSPNTGGNSRKNLVESLEKSLKHLQTDHIDLYSVHMWDFMSPVEEVMRALDDVVRAGKVLYVGISDTPAWIVAQANTLAELRGWSHFVALQVPYALNWRDVERDLLPMAHAFDMTVTAWAILGTGLLTGKFSRAGGDPTRIDRTTLTADQLELADAVVKIAKEIGRTPSQVAINWVRQQQGRANIIPILGARREAQLKDNLACLEFELTDEQLTRLDEASQIKLGFPHDFGGRQYIFGGTEHLIDNHRSPQAKARRTKT